MGAKPLGFHQDHQFLLCRAYVRGQVGREVWSARYFASAGFSCQERVMTTQGPPAGISLAAGAATPAATEPAPMPTSWPWRWGAMLLAGAAQLITIPALLSADPLVVATAGHRPGAAGCGGGVRPGPAEPAGRRGRSPCPGPGRGHRGRNLAHRAVLRPGPGGAGRRHREAVARAVPSLTRRWHRWPVT